VPDNQNDADEMPGSNPYNLCREAVEKFQSMSLPGDLLSARMKLNEGFRCQDLTPYDVITLADHFLETNPDKKSKYVVIGSRTAGSYFAPLLKTYLEYRGFTNMEWMTLRPRFRVGWSEKRKLNHLLRGSPNVILIDDYANTGYTFRKLAGITRSFGIPPGKIDILAPIHPVVASRHDSRDEIDDIFSSGEKVRVTALHHEDLHVAKLMEPQSVEILLRELLSTNSIENIIINKNPEVRKINENLRVHYSDGFQVRLKRVYEVAIYHKDGRIEMKRFLAKSVGVGWLGYHAYFAGLALDRLVPQIIGLRYGILFMEWVDGASLSETKMSGPILSKLSEYVACRTKLLALDEDPRLKRPYLGWGWLEVLSIFRRVYHNLLGYLKYDDLLRRLNRSLHQKSVLVDGRMRPEDWIMERGGNDTSKFDASRLFKVDFEHHNFGAPELDVVDPAYDLAVASFEFKLTEREELEMISSYAEKSGDGDTLSERFFLYKLLYAKVVSDRAWHRLTESNGREALQDLNRRIQWSWDFRVFAMNKFCASLMKKPANEAIRTGICFMDIDGVFDFEVLGFPHTTISGLKAVSLLRSCGYSIIPNTGRSCLHVRNYCSNYGFEAGIGEYGSVILDVVQDKEIPLIDDETANEISVCKKILAGKDSICIDPDYHYAVRAFRFVSKRTQGLGESEAEEILKTSGLNKLKVISRNSDTYFVGKNTSKGKAIGYYKKCTGSSRSSTIAIGDSAEDIPMFDEVAYALAPKNSSPEIQRISKNGKCTILSKSCQRGLLQAAVELSKNSGLNRKWIDKRKGIDFINTYSDGTFQQLMVQLLSIAEQPRYKRLISLIL